MRAYVRPYYGRLAWGVVLLLGTNALDKSIPWLLQGAVDALERSDLGLVKNYALGVVALAAVLWIVRTASRIQVFNVGRDVEYDLRNEMIEQVHRLGPRFFHRVPTGESRQPTRIIAQAARCHGLPDRRSLWYAQRSLPASSR